jgi:UDP-2,3-diacylglucosamine pyrophosphatase LpxH
VKTAVLSDLHISVEPGLFRRHAELASFLESLPGRYEELVLAGDTFDLLAAPGYDGFVPSKSAERMDAILQSPPNEPVVRALRSVAKHATLHIIPGNHDLECDLPQVQERIRGVLASPGSVNMVPGGESLRIPVAGGEAWIAHGNKFDVYNDIDYPAVRKAAHEQPDREIELCPGSKIVLKLVNRFKKDHAWVDQLEPISLVVALLLYVEHDAGKVFEALRDAIGIHAAVLIAAINRMGKGGQLGARGAPAASNLFADDLMQWFGPEQGAPPSGYEQLQLRTLVEGGAAGLRAPHAGTLGADHRGFWPKVLRSMLQKAAAQCHHDFDISQPDSYGSKYGKDAGPLLSVAALGHTHFAKVQRGSDRAYFNTGSWTERIRVEPPATEQEAVAWVDELEQGKVELATCLTFLEIDTSAAEPARMMVWNAATGTSAPLESTP